MGVDLKVDFSQPAVLYLHLVMVDGRLSEGDIARVQMVDGQPTLDGKPVPLSQIEGSLASHVAEGKVRRYEEGLEDRYSGNTAGQRQIEQVRQGLEASACRQERDKFEQGLDVLRNKIIRSSRPGFPDRVWNGLEQRFPRVMGAVGKALDFIGGQ